MYLLNNYDDDCVLQTLFCSKSDAIKTAWTAFENYVLWHACLCCKCACFIHYSLYFCLCLAASLPNKGDAFCGNLWFCLSLSLINVSCAITSLTGCYFSMFYYISDAICLLIFKACVPVILCSVYDTFTFLNIQTNIGKRLAILMCRAVILL